MTPTDQPRDDGSAIELAGDKYASFFAANPHPAFWLDPDGRYRASNSAGTRVSGYTEDELCGRSFSEFLHPDDLPRVLTVFGEVLAGGWRTVDTRLVRKDGRVVDLAITAVRVVEDGEVVGVHGVAEDVTERNLARRRLAESQAALHRATAEAMAVKATFVANVNHEVRTPLTAVLGYLELLADTALDPCQQEFVGTISRSSQRLLHLVDEMLDYGALQAGSATLRAEPLDVRRVVAAAADRAAGPAERAGLTLRTDVADDVPAALVGDGPRLQQVLGALVDNAVKFTDHGRVDVVVSVVPDAEPDAEPDAATGRTWLRLAVRDTGIGIPEEQRLQLFEAFTQADTTMTRRHGGAGLGLAVARQAVVLMGGTIDVDSSAEGSTFTVEVPFESCVT